MVQFWLGNKNTVLKAEGNQSGQCPPKKKKRNSLKNITERGQRERVEQEKNRTLVKA